jgi:D-arabinose 1-dehydrogenase-like Zn-dependent alcohol dehydrogenase
VAGIIDEVGEGVSAWKKGQRVGVGWHGGQDNTCRECRRGDFSNCRNLKICGISYDADTSNTWSFPWKRWCRSPKL